VHSQSRPIFLLAFQSTFFSSLLLTLHSRTNEPKQQPQHLKEHSLQAFMAHQALVQTFAKSFKTLVGSVFYSVFEDEARSP
jgi:hypothetical protein